MDIEREKEAELFEELHGNQEIKGDQDLVNSPESPSSKTCGDTTQTLTTKTIQSTLNPAKSLTLNVSVGESSQGDSLCEDNIPLSVDNPSKSGVSVPAPLGEDTA